ncbi:MAG TPA: membrane protein insertion efficiency factor YidD [Accumulibacter sp.]|uniref:membrane protein insertion efficiency factor YidD n=1 Tax=Accumulibacter sp. TaxID=2053492 RepID=UPI00262024AA|nr:membrane protein insertion efficiency factor YidD [Accumulibacter sp.]MDS4056165.1 membrane protein insertion efficiency factor YidD [Accumulibacter sp.]HMV06760.1 membrane protein insertion efficiency factor YidD [Accumulibacter sp.]HMW64251.1 membrane protein insertion efficiency factor YidD [Accumulibacter sp.]HMX69765.1 membrane protein insertion efficiency factor YidD [Accumulibacter sp.]HNB68656.1 membrane protein insertion efficiency factor YidD [Accumulibacter sp.]
MKTLLLVLIRFYRYAISPCLGPRCRFAPSCSEYAAEAVEKYGAGKGAYLAACRLLRCHPWNPGGFDPVP